MTYDSEGEKLSTRTLFLPGTGKKLRDVFAEIEDLSNAIRTKRVVINDFKAHLSGLKLDLSVDYDAYNYEILGEATADEKENNKLLAQLITRMRGSKIGEWRKLNANAQSVYQFLENRGVYKDGKDVYPRYSTDTFSGRSRTVGFNIQGTTAESDICLDRHDLDLFVHFDWVAADLRVASILSDDDDLISTFERSDPYTEMARELGSGFSRGKCKLEFLKSIYSLDVDNPILELYPRFLEWMKSEIEKMMSQGFLRSILGRRFTLGEDNERSVFSGMISGSVAHAMQASITDIYKLFPANLLTETHDSITMLSNQKDVRAIINGVRDIMIAPFKDYEYDEIFPLKTYVGKRWKKWRPYREYR
jgi:hypothetical protein